MTQGISRLSVHNDIERRLHYICYTQYTYIYILMLQLKTRFHTSNTAKLFMRFNLDGYMGDRQLTRSNLIMIRNKNTFS